MRRRIVALLWFILLGGALYGVYTGARFVFFSEGGARAVFDAVRGRCAGICKIDAQVSGDIAHTVTLNDVLIRDIKGLSEDCYIKVKRVDISFSFPNLRDTDVKVDDGRIFLPNEGRAIFRGELRNSGLNFNLYARDINIMSLLKACKYTCAIKGITGIIQEADLFIKGGLNRPRITGVIKTGQVNYKKFVLDNADIGCDFEVRSVSPFILYGTLSVNGGAVHGDRTAVVDLNKGRIKFSGDIEAPVFELSGTSDVDGIVINTHLVGTIDAPELKLVSSPPIPEDILLVMLFTGRSWGGGSKLSDGGQLPGDIVKDFFDYFIFSDTPGTKFSSYFGLDAMDFVIKDDERSVKLSKNVSDNVNATYQLKTANTPSGYTQRTTQTVGGGVSLTDNVSIQVEREMPVDNNTAKDGSKAVDDRIGVKYKNEF